jgi:transcriptional regulator with XRE-family HTH domain
MKAGTLARDARRRAGLSQREVARRSGLAQPAVSRIERDIGSPRLDTLDELLRACGAELSLAERPGSAVDRTLIRERLALTMGERVRRVVLEWERTRAFVRPRPDPLSGT